MCIIDCLEQIFECRNRNKQVKESSHRADNKGKQTRTRK